jgi:hypothetical protein
MAFDFPALAVFATQYERQGSARRRHHPEEPAALE